jgi:hypothetical protein
MTRYQDWPAVRGLRRGVPATPWPLPVSDSLFSIHERRRLGAGCSVPVMAVLLVLVSVDAAAARG